MLALITDPRFQDHHPGEAHVELPARAAAVLRATRHSAVRDAIVELAPRAASDAELLSVHRQSVLDRLTEVEGTWGQLDADTAVSPDSVPVARLAAGAGLVAIEALRNGDADAAFCAVRPPGHHATPTRSMGFCLVNNIAIVARALADAGERVLIADFDAHHGNGTQDVFYDDPRVLFVSWHQWPLYPGSGRLAEIGSGDAIGTTVNLPVPPRTTGDLYLALIDEVVGGIIDRFGPTWLLISAGFDAHRYDPIAELGLSSGDFAAITSVLMQAVGPGRTIGFLEGGYDVDALEWSAAGCLAALAGVTLHPEAPTSGVFRADLAHRVAVAQGLV